MVKNAISAALKGGGGEKKHARQAAVNGNSFSDEKASGIECLNLAVNEPEQQCMG